MNPLAEYKSIAQATIDEINNLAENISNGKYDQRLEDKVVGQRPFLNVEEAVNNYVVNALNSNTSYDEEIVAKMEKAEDKLLNSIISRADVVDRKTIGKVAVSILNLQGASECIAKRKMELEQIKTNFDHSRIKKANGIENFIEELINQPGVRIAGKDSDEWHEIVFDEHPFNKKEVLTPWKIHIAPSADMEVLLNTLKPVLLEDRPFCKIVPTEAKLEKMQNAKDVNELKTYKGKCITIYPKTEDEAIQLAVKLDRALTDADLDPNESTPPCTDRPLGNSGYLWVRHDLAGGPIDEMSFSSADHAHANPGNYNVTVILPEKAYDFETDEKGRADYSKWYEKEYKNFNRIVHEDIFAGTFGPVVWQGVPESDSGIFIAGTPPEKKNEDGTVCIVQ